MGIRKSYFERSSCPERRKMGNPALVCILVMAFFSVEVMRMNTVAATGQVQQGQMKDRAWYGGAIDSCMVTCEKWRKGKIWPGDFPTKCRGACAQCKCPKPQ